VNRLPKTKQEELGNSLLQQNIEVTSLLTGLEYHSSRQETSSRMSSNSLQPKPARRNITVTGRTMTAPTERQAYRGTTRTASKLPQQAARNQNRLPRRENSHKAQERGPSSQKPEATSQQ